MPRNATRQRDSRMNANRTVFFRMKLMARLGKMTNSIMTLSIMAFRITINRTRHSVLDTQHNDRLLLYGVLFMLVERKGLSSE
jgi:hypothetical protein